MTQVSRRRVDRVVFSRMQEIFYDALGKVRTRKEAQEFMEDFLTSTELIMLPKRLTIAYLLTKGYAQRAIIDYLKVSSTTINKVHTAMKRGGKGYRLVIQALLQDVAIAKFLQSVDDAIAKFAGGGIPVGLGSSNWSAWHKERRGVKRDQQHKPF